MLNCRFRLNGAPVSELIIDEFGIFPAFSGSGAFVNDPASHCLVGIGPIPLGKYYIFDRENGGRTKFLKDLFGFRSDWFALYAIDGEIDDATWCEKVERGEFRLHHGGISEGCITVMDSAQYVTLHHMIKAHGARPVKGSKLHAYGILEVIV